MRLHTNMIMRLSMDAFLQDQQQGGLLCCAEEPILSRQNVTDRPETLRKRDF